MSKDAPSRDQNKVMVRLPDGMRPWLAEEAKRNQRSANGQIVWMLQQQIEALKAQQARAA